MKIVLTHYQQAVSRVTPVRRNLPGTTHAPLGEPGWNRSPFMPPTPTELRLAALDRSMFGDLGEILKALDRSVLYGVPMDEETAAHIQARSAPIRQRRIAKQRALEKVRRERVRKAGTKKDSGKRSYRSYHNAVVSGAPLVSAAAGSRPSPGPARWSKLSNGTYADLATFGSRDEAERISRLGR